MGELATLFFLRTEQSIILFPRVFLHLYLAFCLYYVLTPYGFFEEAVNTWLFGVLWALVRTLRAFEVPALKEGTIGYHRPRAFLARLPAPQPFAPASGILPSLFTIFLPLNTHLPPPPPQDLREGPGAYAIPVPPRDAAMAAGAGQQQQQLEVGP
jgi:hypothetical protein